MVEFTMDESAITEFQQLGGVGTSAPSKPDTELDSEPRQMLAGEDDQLDRWRMLLVELAYLLNATLQDAHYWEGVKTEKNTFVQMVRIFRELEQKPAHDSIIQIYHRGSSLGKTPEKIDYVIKFGEVMVDTATIASLTKRMGLRVKHFEGRLHKSFECFADQNIRTLMVTMPEESDHSLKMMRISLRLISCYNYAAENDTVIEFVKDDQKYTLAPIRNESNQPDPNLTQVAALNDLNSDNMQDLVQKVSNLIKAGKLPISQNQPTNIYQAIFRIKSLRQKLIKPPIEINGDMSTTEQSVQKTATAGGTGLQSGAPGAGGQSSVPGTQGVGYSIDPGIVKARVAKFVKETFGDSPPKCQIYDEECFRRRL